MRLAIFFLALSTADASGYQGSPHLRGHAYNCTKMVTSRDIVVGHLLQSVRTPYPQSCCNECKQNGTCAAYSWTYDNTTTLNCRLFSKVTAVHPGNASVPQVVNGGVAPAPAPTPPPTPPPTHPPTPPPTPHIPSTCSAAKRNTTHAPNGTVAQQIPDMSWATCCARCSQQFFNNGTQCEAFTLYKRTHICILYSHVIAWKPAQNGTMSSMKISPAPVPTPAPAPPTPPPTPVPPSPMDVCDKINTGNVTIRQRECRILMTLFLGTQLGDGWLPGCKDGWGKGDFCDDWNGIICDENKHVRTIYLGSCGLAGFFPTPSIFTLPYLEKVQMPNSQVRGARTALSRHNLSYVQLD